MPDPIVPPIDADAGPAESPYDAAELKALTAGADLKESFVTREKQRASLRDSAFYFAVGVCSLMGIYLFIMMFLIAGDSNKAFSDQAQIAIFAAPIAAIAMITIFIRRGVFLGFSEKGTEEDNSVLSKTTGFIASKS